MDIREQDGKLMAVPDPSIRNQNLTQIANSLIPFIDQGYFGRSSGGNLVTGVPKEMGGIYYQYIDKEAFHSPDPNMRAGLDRATQLQIDLAKRTR